MPSWCHCLSLSLASVKSRLVLPLWYWLTRVVLDKGPLNGCVCVCVCDLLCFKPAVWMRDSDWSIVDSAWANQMLSLTHQESVSTSYIFMELMRWAHRMCLTILLSLHPQLWNGLTTLHVCMTLIPLLFLWMTRSSATTDKPHDTLYESKFCQP